MSLPRWAKLKAALLQIGWRYGGLLYALLAIGASLQAYWLGPKPNSPYTHYNNFLIFRQAYFHLCAGQDLYRPYPAEHWDLFKYSPTFPLLMAPLAYLPDWLGLMGWNLLNALVLFWGVRSLPLAPPVQSPILLFSALELLTALQNAQSNALIAGLLLLSVGAYERGQFFWGSLPIALTGYIKIFGLGGYLIGLFYPARLRIALYGLFWIALLAVLPLGVVAPAQLSALYASWGRLLAQDYGASVGLSVAGWLYAWFGEILPKAHLTLIGALALLLPLLRWRLYASLAFRQLFLAYFLLWSVLFNHKAESPTYVIAVVGVSLWYFSRRRTSLDTMLLIGVFLFASLSPTDLFPKALRESLVKPYYLKPFSCLLVWLRLGGELLWGKRAFFEENGPSASTRAAG
ncbi:MAG: glycosyltransferase family 87 protein [Bacteroidia bacterium]